MPPCTGRNFSLDVLPNTIRRLPTCGRAIGHRGYEVAPGALIAIGMAASIETLGAMAAKRRGGLGHTAGSAALVDCTTRRLIQAVRLMVSASANRSTVSMVSVGSSSCTSRRGRVATSVMFSLSFKRRKNPAGAPCPGRPIPSPPHPYPKSRRSRPKTQLLILLIRVSPKCHKFNTIPCIFHSPYHTMRVNPQGGSSNPTSLFGWVPFDCRYPPSSYGYSWD